jgi:hypothetical protein
MLSDNLPVSDSMGVVVSRDLVLPRVYLAMRDLLLYIPPRDKTGSLRGL